MPSRPKPPVQPGYKRCTRCRCDRPESDYINSKRAKPYALCTYCREHAHKARTTLAGRARLQESSDPMLTLADRWLRALSTHQRRPL